MKREKPPIDCRTTAELSARDDIGDYYVGGKDDATAKVYVYAKSVVIGMLKSRDMIEMRRDDFDAMVRWYTGTEKQPRTTRRKGK